jgi:hypothetical protein
LVFSHFREGSWWAFWGDGGRKGARRDFWMIGMNERGREMEERNKERDLKKGERRK